eukprot:22342-Hanusia_phi.AAC.1
MGREDRHVEEVGRGREERGREEGEGAGRDGWLRISPHGTWATHAACRCVPPSKKDSNRPPPPPPPPPLLLLALLLFLLPLPPPSPLLPPPHRPDPDVGDISLLRLLAHGPHDASFALARVVEDVSLSHGGPDDELVDLLVPEQTDDRARRDAEGLARLESVLLEHVHMPCS